MDQTRLAGRGPGLNCGSKLRRKSALWRLCVIADELLSGGRTHLDIARAAIAGGADVIQLRDKTASSRQLLAAALDLRRLTAEIGVAFIVNDRLDIALASDADGLHVGQDDIPAAVARNLLGPNKILGVSARSLDEALRAEQDGADYLGVGPIFEARATKNDAGEPLGLDLLRQVRKTCRIPILAIGGIDRTNVAAVIRAGATGVAIISAIIAAPDVTAATRTCRDLIAPV
jgi:thiamine-phosphate pyrophosphorylase